MNPAETDRRGDEEFALDILVATTDDDAKAKHTRLLRVVRNHRTRNVELLLPEQTAIVSLGWVPQITYEATDAGYSLSAVIRPDLTPFVAETNAVRKRADEPSPARLPALPPAPDSVEKLGASTEHPPPSHTSEVLYEVTLANREIRVNGFRLSRPNFNSENELVFEHLFRNANRKVELAEIEAVLGRPLAKKLGDVVRDLGFTKALRDLFFPGVSKTAIQFVNPVTRADFAQRGLSPPQLDVR